MGEVAEFYDGPQSQSASINGFWFGDCLEVSEHVIIHFLRVRLKITQSVRLNNYIAAFLRSPSPTDPPFRVIGVRT